jgi:hypothetical protein
MDISGIVQEQLPAVVCGVETAKLPISAHSLNSLIYEHDPNSGGISQLRYLASAFGGSECF